MRFPSPFPVAFAQPTKSVMVEAGAFEYYVQSEAPSLRTDSLFTVATLEATKELFAPSLRRVMRSGAEVCETSLIVFEPRLRRSTRVLFEVFDGVLALREPNLRLSASVSPNAILALASILPAELRRSAVLIAAPCEYELTLFEPTAGVNARMECAIIESMFVTLAPATKTNARLLVIPAELNVNLLAPRIGVSTSVLVEVFDILESEFVFNPVDLSLCVKIKPETFGTQISVSEPSLKRDSVFDVPAFDFEFFLLVPKQAYIILRLDSEMVRQVKINSGMAKTVKLNSLSKYDRKLIF